MFYIEKRPPENIHGTFKLGCNVFFRYVLARRAVIQNDLLKKTKSPAESGSFLCFGFLLRFGVFGGALLRLTQGDHAVNETDVRKGLGEIAQGLFPVNVILFGKEA